MTSRYKNSRNSRNIDSRGNGNRNRTIQLTQLSLLTAAALILYIVESRLPAPVPIPGVKLGLANIITVVAVYRFRPGEVMALVAVRLILGSFFAGSMSALMFSAAGALLCLVGMLFLRKILSVRYIPLCSVLGAVLHNIGQIVVAIGVMRDVKVVAYLPILLVTGCIAGLFTGVCARAVESRIPKKC